MKDLASWINQSLRRRVAVLVSALLLVVGAGISLVSYLEVLRVTRRLRADRLRELGQQLAPILARGPADAGAALSKLAVDSSIIEFLASGGIEGRAEVDRRIHKALPASNQVAVVVADTGGVVLLEVGLPQRLAWYGPPPARSDPAGADSVRQVTPLKRLNDSTLIYDLRTPIGVPGHPVGALMMRGRINLTGAARNTFQVLLGTETGIVLGSPATGVWTDLGRIVSAPPESVRVETVTQFSWENIDYIGSATPIHGTPWLLVVRSPQAVVDAPAHAYLQRAAVIALLLVGLGTAAAVGLGRRIGRPIEEITEVAEQIISGDDARRTSEAGPGEVGRLARSFNAMVDRVASSTRRLRESEASHRAFVAHASEGIWNVEFVPPISTSLSRDLQIDSWYKLCPLAECNLSLAWMYGIESSNELATVPLAELFPEDDPASRKLLSTFIDNGYRCTGVESTVKRDGDLPRIFVNDLIGIVEKGGVRRIWGIRREVTLERQMDERLAQTQRLEAVGRLAGGIAHDFNNLLTAILGYADSFRDRLSEGDPRQEDAAEIERLTSRAAELTRHLLAFSRGQVLRPASLDLNSVVRSTQGLLRRVIGEDIELKLSLAEPLGSIEADSGQIERVLMNLALNARDAMPGGGTLELRTLMTEVDEVCARARPGLTPGPYVMLAVSDTGVGMTEEIRRHIFEPFFTTKPPGQGTGLGLSTVYGVVRQSGGDISVYTEPGQGSTFKIFFPVRGRPISPTAKPAQTPLADHGGSERVLLVEDEPPVREIVRRALSGAGYEVVMARDAQEALDLGEARLGEIDLLLTDMILPGMSGRELVSALRTRRPELRVIIMSGYTGETYPALESLPAGVGFLEKPFSLVDLRRKVREALDEGARELGS